MFYIFYPLQFFLLFCVVAFFQHRYSRKPVGFNVLFFVFCALLCLALGFVYANHPQYIICRECFIMVTVGYCATCASTVNWVSRLQLVFAFAWSCVVLLHFLTDTMTALQHSIFFG